MRTGIASTFEAERMNIAVGAPELSRALVVLERELRIDLVLRELVKLRASILNGCAYCIDLHTKDARQAGESESLRGTRRPSSTSASGRRWRSPMPLPLSPTRTSRRPFTTRPRAISTPRSSTT
jgi:AhpD family alkylhydroperoxidase